MSYEHLLFFRKPEYAHETARRLESIGIHTSFMVAKIHEGASPLQIAAFEVNPLKCHLEWRTNKILGEDELSKIASKWVECAWWKFNVEGKY